MTKVIVVASLETHGAVSLLTSGTTKGNITLDSASTFISVKGGWNQDLAGVVDLDAASR